MICFYIWFVSIFGSHPTHLAFPLHRALYSPYAPSPSNSHLGPRVDVGVRLQQHARHLRMALGRSEMQRGEAIILMQRGPAILWSTSGESAAAWARTQIQHRQWWARTGVRRGAGGAAALGTCVLGEWQVGDEVTTSVSIFGTVLYLA